MTKVSLGIRALRPIEHFVRPYSRTIRGNDNVELLPSERFFNLTNFTEHKAKGFFDVLIAVNLLLDYAWEINTPKTMTISSNARIACMTAVLGRLWVGCNNQVIVLNTTTLEIEVHLY